jgi:hypothetical protein
MLQAMTTKRTYRIWFGGGERGRGDKILKLVNLLAVMQPPPEFGVLHVISNYTPPSTIHILSTVLQWHPVNRSKALTWKRILQSTLFSHPINRNVKIRCILSQASRFQKAWPSHYLILNPRYVLDTIKCICSLPSLRLLSFPVSRYQKDTHLKYYSPNYYCTVHQSGPN